MFIHYKTFTGAFYMSIMKKMMMKDYRSKFGFDETV